MPAAGISLILIAVGAILAFAVTSTVEGISVQTVGLILMTVGFLGLLMSMLFLMSFSPFSRTTTVTDDRGHHIDHVS